MYDMIKLYPVVVLFFLVGRERKSWGKSWRLAYLREGAKFMGYPGRVLGILGGEKSLRPLFQAKKNFPPFFASPKVSPLFLPTKEKLVPLFGGGGSSGPPHKVHKKYSAPQESGKKSLRPPKNYMKIFPPPSKVELR